MDDITGWRSSTGTTAAMSAPNLGSTAMMTMVKKGAAGGGTGVGVGVGGKGLDNVMEDDAWSTQCAFFPLSLSLYLPPTYWGLLRRNNS